MLRASEDGGAGLARLSDPSTMELLVRSASLAIVVVVGAAVIALPTAFLTARTDLPGRRILTIALALPLAIPSYMGAFALIAALGPAGLLSELFGGQWPDLYGFGGAAVVLSLLAYPYMFLPARAALLGVDPRLEETARTLGKSPLATFRRVTLPLAAPAIAGGALMVALYTLSDFGAVSMLRAQTFTEVIYTDYDAFDRGGAAALALVLVALTALLLGLMASRQRRERRYTAKRRSEARHPAFKLGPWRWPAFVFCVLVIFVALLLPVLVTVYWAATGGNVCEFCTPVAELGVNSLLVALLTAGVAMMLVIPVVRWALRGRHRLASLPDRIIYGGFALPGIVVALALVFVGNEYLPMLYQTLPLLVVACVIRFLPQAADAVRPALAQLAPSLEEASRTLGAGRWATFRRVTMPLIRSGWLAGGVLVFLTTVKELPATLLLAPTGYDTLATELWDLTNEGFIGEAAVRCLGVVVLGVLPMIWLVRREGRL